MLLCEELVPTGCTQTRGAQYQAFHSIILLHWSVGSWAQNFVAELPSLKFCFPCILCPGCTMAFPFVILSVFFSFPNWEQPSEGVCGTLPWGVVARNPAIDDVSCTTWRLLLARLWDLRVGETAGFFALSSVSLNLLCSICSNYMEAPEITGRADRTTSLFIHSFNFQKN